MTKQEELAKLQGFMPLLYSDAVAERAMCALMRARDELSKKEPFKHYADIKQAELIVTGFRVLRLSANKHTVYAFVIAYTENHLEIKVVVDLKEESGVISVNGIDENNATSVYINIAEELFPERCE